MIKAHGVYFCRVYRMKLSSVCSGSSVMDLRCRNFVLRDNLQSNLVRRFMHLSYRHQMRHKALDLRTRAFYVVENVFKRLCVQTFHCSSYPISIMSEEFYSCVQSRLVYILHSCVCLRITRACSLYRLIENGLCACVSEAGASRD